MRCLRSFPSAALHAPHCAWLTLTLAVVTALQRSPAVQDIIASIIGDSSNKVPWGPHIGCCSLSSCCEVGPGTTFLLQDSVCMLPGYSISFCNHRSAVRSLTRQRCALTSICCARPTTQQILQRSAAVRTALSWKTYRKANCVRSPAMNTGKIFSHGGLKPRKGLSCAGNVPSTNGTEAKGLSLVAILSLGQFCECPT